MNCSVQVQCFVVYRCRALAKLRYAEKGFNLGINSLCDCFSIDIKNYVFRTETKIKIQCSCCPVKCFLAVKQDQVISKDRKIFRKVQGKC